ncbi:MAG: phenylacetate-CoA oxygenase subunit PaaJ [Gemmatimonadetes bacterium]|nr:phenylacetate-CoA oxygenase subunit PaaJ [Gemmatimonadota bacterium]
MNPALPTRDELFAILDGVKDPEVPVISVVELGIVRDARADAAGVTVTITPTYSGCPAMHTIEQDIRAALAERGLSRVTIETVHAPAWTTEWIGPAAREKLRAFGIAPPGAVEQGGLVTLTRRRAPVACPYCGSRDTELRSEFGSTACKAIHVCRACRQPFDEFKPL